MTHRMIDVKATIEERRRRLAAEPFLQNLAASEELEDLRAIIPQLYFFVFAFQDMLRLAHERIEDPKLRKIAGLHRAEDAGHQVWFVNDAVKLDCTRDVVWVFSDEHTPARDFSYTLIAEILSCGHDELRLLFPLVLEAAGGVFFERVVKLADRTGYGAELEYFAQSHHHVEQSHDMFTDEGSSEIDQIPLTSEVYGEALGLVDRSFAACEAMAAHLEAHRSAR